MRKVAAVLLLLVTSTVYAQRPRRELPPAFGPNPLMLNMVEQYSTQLQALAVAVKRDSFIVAQMVAAAGELNDDFQKHVALDKAHDHIELAVRKAGENPAASAVVQTAVSQAKDIVDHWRDNADSADLKEVNRQVLIKVADVQPVLFRDLDEMRKNKVALKDLLAKLNGANDALDDAMNEALLATFDFFRSGGSRF